MKTIFNFALLGLLSLSLSGCFDTSILEGSIQADSDDGPFGSVIGTGLLTKANELQTKTLTLTGTNGSNVLTLNLAQVGGDTTSNCLIEGSYEFTSTSQNAQLLFASSSETYTKVLECKAIITACDEEENIISGSFEGKMTYDGGDTLSFTNGTFTDVKYIVQ